jgi:hypothetical protein
MVRGSNLDTEICFSLLQNIQTGLMLFISVHWKQNKTKNKKVERGTGAQWASYSMGTCRKRPGSEVDNATPSTAQVKNEWSNTSIYNAYKYSEICRTLT